MKILGTKSRRSPSSSIGLPAYTPRGMASSPVHPPRRTVHFPALVSDLPRHVLASCRSQAARFLPPAVLSFRYPLVSPVYPVLCTLAPGRRSAHNAQRNSIPTISHQPRILHPPLTPAAFSPRIDSCPHRHHYYHHVTVRCFRFVQHTNQPMFSSVGRTVCPCASQA